jgi:hypothetical protein
VELLGGQGNTEALLEWMLAEALTPLPGSLAGTGVVWAMRCRAVAHDRRTLGRTPCGAHG